MADTAILHVGDKVAVNRLGIVEVEKIDVCLRPTEDPAGERFFANVEALEVGEWGPPFVIGVKGGGWAYGNDVDRHTIEKGSSE